MLAKMRYGLYLCKINRTLPHEGAVLWEKAASQNLAALPKGCEVPSCIIRFYSTNFSMQSFIKF